MHGTDFNLTVGQELTILVGQMGIDTSTRVNTPDQAGQVEINLVRVGTIFGKSGVLISGVGYLIRLTWRSGWRWSHGRWIWWWRQYLQFWF